MPAENPLPLDQCFVDHAVTGDPVLRGAPDGTELPIVPEYKANITGRYGSQIGSLDANVQAAYCLPGRITLGAGCRG